MRGQASSRSLGRSGATAPCGTPRATPFGLPVLAGAWREVVDSSALRGKPKAGGGEGEEEGEGDRGERSRWLGPGH